MAASLVNAENATEHVQTVFSSYRQHTETMRSIAIWLGRGNCTASHRSCCIFGEMGDAVECPSHAVQLTSDAYKAQKDKGV